MGDGSYSKLDAQITYESQKSGCTNTHPCALGSTAPVYNLQWYSLKSLRLLFYEGKLQTSDWYCKIKKCSHNIEHQRDQ